jgi:hypothetical protein
MKASSNVAKQIGGIGFVVAALLAGCGSEVVDDGNGNAAGGAGSGNGFGAGSSGGNGGDGDIDPDAACASEVLGDALKPLAMYILLDRSSSMNSGGRWTAAETALGQFVDDPSMAGIKVAFDFFPNPHSNSTERCDGSLYTAPLVPMGALPGNGASVKDAIDETSFTSLGTPIEGALHGLRRFCGTYAQAHPSEQTVGVLVTDGEPNGCSSNTGTLSAVAKQAFDNNPSNPLYMVGMEGADFDQLDAIAAAGGTEKGFNVSQGGAQAFLDALKTIAGSAIPCEIAMPQSSTGTVDPNKINVRYTGADETLRRLGQVAGAGACVPNAWYYDDPSNPSKIVLCPQTCSAVTGEAGGKLEIVLGCVTNVNPPS